MGQDYKLIQEAMKHYGMLHEALGLGSWSYKISKDPEERIFDFYYISLIGNPQSLQSDPTTGALGSIPERIWGGRDVKPTYSGMLDNEQVEELVAAVRQTQSRIFNFLQGDLLDAVFFSICAEMKHVVKLGQITHSGLKPAKLAKARPALPKANKEAHVLYLAEKLGVKNEYAKWYKTFALGKTLGSPKKFVLDKMDPADPLAALAIRSRLYTDPTARTTKIIKDPKTGEDITKKVIDDSETFFENNSDRIASYVAAKKAFKGQEENFIQLAADCFFDLKWGSSYGGKSWGNIARGWLKLNAATKPLDKMIWIDHIFDLQHNTGTVLNKVERYNKSGTAGFAWINKALEYKKHAERPLLDFKDKISLNMTFLADRLQYALTGIAKDREEVLYPSLKKKKVSTSLNTEFASLTGEEDEDDIPEFKVGSTYKFSSSAIGKLDQVPFTVLSIGSTGKVYGKLGLAGLMDIDKDDLLTQLGLAQTVSAALDQDFKVSPQGELLGIQKGGKGSGFANFIPITKAATLMIMPGPAPAFMTQDEETGLPPKVTVPTAPSTQTYASPIVGAYYKFTSKKIAHTGPAGKKGEKSLIVNLAKSGQEGLSRQSFSGYFKVKEGNKKNYIYHDEDEFNLIYYYAQPKGGKCVVRNLKFSVHAKKMAIHRGKIYNAIMPANNKIYITPLSNDEFTDEDEVEFYNCIIGGLHITGDTSNNVFFNQATYDAMVKAKTTITTSLHTVPASFTPVVSYEDITNAKSLAESSPKSPMISMKDIEQYGGGKSTSVPGAIEKAQVVFQFKDKANLITSSSPDNKSGNYKSGNFEVGKEYNQKKKGKLTGEKSKILYGTSSGYMYPPYGTSSGIKFAPGYLYSQGIIGDYLFVWNNETGDFVGSYNRSTGKVLTLTTLKSELTLDPTPIDPNADTASYDYPSGPGIKDPPLKYPGVWTDFPGLVNLFKKWVLTNHGDVIITTPMLNAFKKEMNIPFSNPDGKKLYVFVGKKKKPSEIKGYVESYTKRVPLFKDFITESNK